MAAHDAWALVCRLFAGGTPVLRTALSPRDLAALPTLGRAVKATALDQRFVLCPYCHQHRAPVWGDGRGGRTCHCPECGPVAVVADDVAALMLDEDWLRQKLRLALEIESRDGIDDLGNGAWRLGDVRRSPVILARKLERLWCEPALLDRVRVAAGPVRVITPKPRETLGAPFGQGVEWLALEDRFAFYGGGISFIGAPGAAIAQQPLDPTTPVYGPFSADFKWVNLSGWQHGPIHCTDAQAQIFKTLWSFKGVPMPGQRVLDRAGVKSDKPIDLFKVKSRDKGKPVAEGRYHAFKQLVEATRDGLYSMPCAATTNPALS